jgi:D-alanine-D-alanine ligase
VVAHVVAAARGPWIHELEDGPMKIALLFDGASALGARPDLLILETVEAVERVLAAEGNQVVRIPVDGDGRWIERIRRGKFTLAFNLCEGVDGIAPLEPSVIAVLELLEVPYTGSSSWTTALCLRKPLVNGLLERAGLPVPPFAVARRGAPLPTVGFPAICKPAAEDASVGVEQRSVVRTAAKLAERVWAMQERWDEVLVQRYVGGREVNVGILGEETLPIAEIRFDGMPKGMWRIVSYRSKWEPGCDEDLGAVPRCPAALEPSLTEELKCLAVAAWRAVGGGASGYGRVDFRVDRYGRPWLLEVNANPDLAPDAGLARMALVAGLDYGALVRGICERALGEEVAVPIEARWTMAQRLSGVAAEADPVALDLFTVASGGAS